MIRFDGAGKRHPDGTIAVGGLDLDVPTGRITVLVGPSGCGKTTLLRMVNRMVEPTSGRVLLDGTDVAELEPAKLRRGIGYVIQQAGLFPHRRVIDNIATVPYLLGWDRKKARARAAELLELVGLAPETGKRYPFQLSGGQQQRVGVARALAADPPVLLMDEPFSAVDPVVRAGLQDELLRLQSELHKTVLFVTHDIEEAVRLGDQVVVLREQGRIAQLADPHTLLTAPADDDVAAFLGRDRGLRGLGLRPASAVTVRPVADGLRHGGWELALDDQRRPIGWIDRDAPSATLHPAAGYHPGTDTLRSALDAAVLSPAGVAVALDADGRATGTASREAVLAALTDTPAAVTGTPADLPDTPAALTGTPVTSAGTPVKSAGTVVQPAATGVQPAGSPGATAGPDGADRAATDGATGGR
ncbi:ATP-binding cassette domain-containing protein [Streptomyces sp. CB01881]|uniref:ATP-binding cassette domain-containing protein n=1 Tax=Streptomyces sp. CB01881 TaxID=2078691 RepID=UPI000CDC004D|nr:ATP-binding cassette domain-containing protein [Streptomyces sp. CB01881]AUY49017.1 proline/glycine betaine ABC transporter ATP-binding protein [Streptomyces sp. CB01881]TYC77507.1 ATP-binding cassette domain-containing protein [Streptomyces sp. CB01881]